MISIYALLTVVSLVITLVARARIVNVRTERDYSELRRHVDRLGHPWGCLCQACETPEQKIDRLERECQIGPYAQIEEIR